MSFLVLSDVKDQLNIGQNDDSQDGELAQYLDAITTPIENHLREIVEPREFIEDVEPCGRPRFWLTNTPVISLTSLVSLDGVTSYDPANFTARPSGLVYTVCGPRPVGIVTVTYQAGYVTVPENIKRAALEAIEDVWTDSQRGVAGVGAASRANMEQIRQRLTYVLSYKVSAWLGQPRTLAR